MRTKITRRSVLLWGLAGSSAAILSACTPKTPTPAPKATDVPKVAATVAPAPTTAKPAVTGPVTIKVWVQEAFGKDAWAEVDKAFHAAQGEVKVERSIFPHGDMEAKTLTALAAAEPLDVIYVHPMFNNTYAIKGAILPLDDYLPSLGIPDSDWYPVFAFHKWRGKTWALPYQDNPHILGYNPDLVKAAGLTEPRDLWKQGKWNQAAYDEYAQKLTKGTGPSKQFGTGITIRESIRSAPVMWLWGNKADVWNKDETETLVTSPEAIEALSDLAKSSWNTWAPEPGDMQGVSGNAVWDKVAMGGIARWTMMLAKQGGKFPNVRCLPHFAFTKSGKSEVRDATNACGLFAKGKNKDAAWKYIKWMVTEGHIVLIKLGWVTPLRKSLMGQDYWISQLTPPYEDPEVYKVAADSVRLMSHVVNIGEIDKLFLSAFDEIVLKKKTVKQAMEGVKPGIDDILKATAKIQLP